MLGIPKNVPVKTFALALKKEIAEDNISIGAAALAYYLMLAIFPAAIALLTLLPYLPIPHLQEALMDFLRQLLPGDAAKLFSDTIDAIMSQRRGGLLTAGLALAIWSASSGLYAIMRQLNVTYDIKEGRGFLKTRGTALLLTLAFGVLIVGAFALVVFGGVLQGWIGDRLGWSPVLLTAFAALRWVIIGFALLLAFALTYYFGPDVKQDFKFITPGAVLGAVALILASLAFSVYTARFGTYSKVYGSLGAVIILLLWLYIAGSVILLGSEVNALVEHFSAAGKSKGEKAPGRTAFGRDDPPHGLPQPTS